MNYNVNYLYFHINESLDDLQHNSLKLAFKKLFSQKNIHLFIVRELNAARDIILI